ncbi:S8 family serine peptidase [Actinokineospora sp. HUAS TT18]|uniref:S8 family peptidase n=1 Tax=Actinokineospora sp. HUAS TT18 TaxID=3447451 RepID=UPI003F51CA09
MPKSFGTIVRTSAVVLSALTAVTVASSASSASDRPQKFVAPTGASVKDSYLVEFNQVVSEEQRGSAADHLARENGGRVGYVFKRAFHGFSVNLSEAQARRLAADPKVKRVEQEAVAEADTVQANPPWHLDRVDQRTAPLDNKYDAPSTGQGSGSTIFVVDSGLRTTHSVFAGRARIGADYSLDFTQGDRPFGEDCRGHGTHVAGLAAGTTYGIARSAQVVAVKVINCTGTATVTSVVQGIEWIIDNAPARSVVNMSLSFPSTRSGVDALEASIRAAKARNITFVVSAGNDDIDACEGSASRSPARMPEVITVGATDDDDERASFSNFGSCLDIFAPGVGIVSSSASGDTSTEVKNGTSMSAPQVAGALAVITGRYPPGTAHRTLENKLLRQGTLGVVGDANAPQFGNLLLHSGSRHTNDIDFLMADVGVLNPVLAISGKPDTQGSSSMSVSVDITHPARGQLQVDLIAPNGREYRIHSPSSDTGDNITVQDRNFDGTGVPVNGTWRLRVIDSVSGAVGTLTSWTLQL